MAIFVSDAQAVFSTIQKPSFNGPGDPAGVAGGGAGSPDESPGQRHASAVDDSPRPVNTGAENSVPTTNRCLIDWVAFTVKTPDPLHIIKILNLDESLFIDLDRGGSGYLFSKRFGGISIYYQGREDMGCHCIISGQGCRQYEAQFQESPWLDLIGTVLSHMAKFTRLDLALDNVDSSLDLDKLKSAILVRAIRTRFKNASHIQNYGLSHLTSNSNAGFTIYFGKRSSRVYLRFYDKARQMLLQCPWVRAELELKEKRAHEAARLIASGIAMGQLFVGIINNYLTIINLDNANLSRCSIQHWWANWLKSTQKIRLTTAPQAKTVEESMSYVKRQYAPSVAMFHEYLGAESFASYINELLKDGRARMTIRHEQMLFVSAQSNNRLPHGEGVKSL